MTTLTLLLAQTTTGTSDNKLAILAVILAGVALFISLIALFGRILSATDKTNKAPAPAAQPAATTAAPAKSAPVETPAPNSATDTPSEQILAVIAAVVATVCGPHARIAGVQTAKPASVENLMQIWSLEGRRQIYTSHSPRR